MLGTNNGLVSTASRIVGVAASAVETSEILVAGSAGLLAGAMSMAAGECVSVSSQANTEQADLARERQKPADAPAPSEGSWCGSMSTMAKYALGTHVRD